MSFINHLSNTIGSATELVLLFIGILIFGIMIFFVMRVIGVVGAKGAETRSAAVRNLVLTVVALAVMVSVWAIVAFLSDVFLGPGRVNEVNPASDFDLQLPQI